jgi:hypothetical protein
MEKFFLAYDEPNAEKNFQLAKEKIKDLKKIDTKMSIAQSHKHCANISDTNQFMLIDGDAVLLDDFNLFDVYKKTQERGYIYIFRARNPINGLEYGHGGIKIFDKTLFDDQERIDFSTSFYGRIKIVEHVLNYHAYNSTAFHAWRTAFRECVKLASGTIKNRNIKTDEARLKIWCTESNDSPFAYESLKGARAGEQFGRENKDNQEALKKINDFVWLKNQYEQLD